jgi:cellulose synthase/poly-beta-1,6-N-acetylglucosamine synthase-like glycosyltransferase
MDRRTRHQWGADRRKEPLPAREQPASDGEVAWARAAIVATLGLLVGYVVTTSLGQVLAGGSDVGRLGETMSYLLLVTLLALSASAYLLARLGAFYRSRTHRRTPRAQLDEFFQEHLPTLTVLIPSYREDKRVIRQSVLSAALQEYPYLRLTLLIDDPPHPDDEDAREMLRAARDLPAEIEALLDEPRRRFEAALERVEARFQTDADAPTSDDVATLAADYDEAAAWLEQLAVREVRVDHTDDFLIDHVIRRLSADLETVAVALRAAVADGAAIERARFLQLSRRLAWTFRCGFSAFERKKYASLSHDASKAMNLNCHLGLMGGAYAEHVTADGLDLVPTTAGSGHLEIPAPDYVLTLDADSVLLPEYALRMVHLLEQPEHRGVAVAQTPYSAFPNAATRLERIAGATTDLQHIVHQGMTHYDATFWVGANAVLRKTALDEVVQVTQEDGHEVRRYIRDRTVIEDTESTIDLVGKGWRLVNYPERLSYSATPVDFGSLCIQRRRWANGGLLILPRLRHLLATRRQAGDRTRIGELILRVNYMGSITWANIGLLVLLAYPYPDRLLSPLTYLVALPYFLAMAADLKRCGYRRRDVARIYGFNLILLPVNLAGVFRSLVQAVTGRKQAFARTPKVKARTAAPFWMVLTPFLMVGLATYTVVRDLEHGHWSHAAFAGLTGVLAAYAIVAFVGVRHAVVDLGVNMLSWLYVDAPATEAAADVSPAPVDWAAVLHYGDTGEPVRRRDELVGATTADR